MRNKSNVNVYDYKITEFAYLPKLEEKLAMLAEMIRDEEEFLKKGKKRLQNYFFSVFELAQKNNFLVKSAKGNHIALNLGVRSNGGAEIYAIFAPNNTRGKQKYYLKGFFKSSDNNVMSLFGERHVPSNSQKRPDYYFEKLIFDTEHMVARDRDEKRNLQAITGCSEKELFTILRNKENELSTAIRDNSNMLIPEFYCGEIMYLWPVTIAKGRKSVDLVLAIQGKEKGVFRGNTLITKEMAYGKARVCSSLEGTWLAEDKVFKKKRSLFAWLKKS